MKNFVSVVIKALLSITEQNVSGIEKVQNRYKLGRFLGTNIFLLSALLIIFGTTLIHYKYLHEYFKFSLAVPLISGVIFTFVLERTNSMKSKTAALFVINLSLGVAFSLALTEAVTKNLNRIFEPQMLLSIIGIFLLLLWMLFLLLKTSKNLGIVAIDQFHRTRYVVCILLVNNTSIEGEILTITNKGDFILRIVSKKSEIFIKSSSIATIKIVNEI
ncbi:hypothetical protein ACTHPJ_24055 [Paenibacillus amylolyticus]|uniref:hypothetical protein n=1 Tax=Paenibacillus amylolyticus TaxID=1451 RepID=UPI003F8124A1